MQCRRARQQPPGGQGAALHSLPAHRPSGGGSYFIAARLDWSLLKPVDPKTQPWFGFTAVVNDSDRTGEREIAFLTPGLHDAKYSNCYFNAMLPTSRPEFRLLPGKDASPDFLGGELLAAGLQGSCRFSAEWEDSSGKIHQGEIGTVEVTSAENLLKLPFQLRLPAGFEGRYHLTLRMNGRKVLEQEGSKLSPEREAAENINRLLARLDRTNRAIDALERKGKRSHYLSVPRKILNLHLPEIAGRFNAAKREGERNYYARQINMITPECQELFSEMEANIRKLENGGTLPQTWSYRPRRSGWSTDGRLRSPKTNPGGARHGRSSAPGTVTLNTSTGISPFCGSLG
ncbi:MAG: hypothetical protein L6W00_16640 [Lentisphaeria bacterium]|nr:MAG: hypothetical protein L6W00_16640 [Lentisphaeria bacterium]